LTSANGRATVSRAGAQVLAARLGDRPLLWLSPIERQPWRGGIPICFPWFGKHPDGLPSHGFARNRDWHLADQATDRVVFTLDDDDATRALWPYRFHAELAVRLDDALHLTFSVTNTDPGPFTFTYALHSYFAVESMTGSHVDGLDGCPRRDGDRIGTQSGPVTLDRPIDAVFEPAPHPLILHGGRRGVAVEAPEMTSAVVWNPGANDLPDVGDRWPEFVCVERGRIGAAAVTLPPGATHTASMRVTPTG
jgi:D-hexose-6-phosphate mutarotase